MSVAPKMGRSDRPRVLLSSSAGTINVTPEDKDYFDAALRLPEPISFAMSGSVTGSNQQLIGDDDYKVIQMPQYLLNHQAYGLPQLWIEKDPFVEMDQFNPVIYLEDPLQMAYPVVMENPSPIDPFDFNGAIEPFALRRPLAGYSTFIGSHEDPEPTGMGGSVSSGMVQSVFYRKSTPASNWYFPDAPEIEPFEAIGAEEEFDEPGPPSRAASTTISFSDVPTVGETIVLEAADGTSQTYTAAPSTDTGVPAFSTSTAVLAAAGLYNCIGVNQPTVFSLKYVASETFLTITQTTAGSVGNTPVTSSLSNTSAPNFTAGAGPLLPIHGWVKPLDYMTDVTSSVAPFVDATSPEDAFYGITDGEIRVLMEKLFTKANQLGVPNRKARSAPCGWEYDNNPLGIDSLAYGGMKK